MSNKKSFLKGALCGALVVFLITSLAACSNLISKKIITGDDESKVDTLKGLIEEYYLREPDEKALEQGIYKGYISGLDDPYSVYYDEEETKSLNESVTGRYFGVGALLSQDKDTGIITISRVFEGSPAQEAGLRDNDILYKVSGEEVTGEDLESVVKNIKGETGTQVELTVLRGDDREEIVVTATRREVESETVSSEMKEDGVGYIRITEFDSVTYDQYKSALEKLENDGMERLVVDLRSNPGGDLDIVCDILDLMLPKGTIVYTETKTGEKTVYSSDEEHQFTKPLVVLVNGFSASASEIFAGAVQDYQLGDLVGTTTYGKGVVQQLFDLQDGTCVKLTIAEYFTPNGRNIDGEGITPEVEVEAVYDENNPEADNQLEKALEIVKGK